ncbi:hypothetical protein ACFQ0D_36010, partial [Micromonospora zhanjiangensis]
MLIDCDSCAVRGAACSGCVVSALFDAPEQVAALGPAEDRAIEVLTRAGFEVEVLSPPAPSVPHPPLRVLPRRRRR